MARIVELLERENYTPVDGTKFKKYSEPVNILRLILTCQLRDYESLPTGPKVKKAFEESENLKEITTRYNSLRKVLKTKKSIAALKPHKKKLYDLLFETLLRYAKINSYKPSVLGTAFAKTKHGELNDYQKKVIIKFAKTLLHEKPGLRGRDTLELTRILVFENDVKPQQINQNDEEVIPAEDTQNDLEPDLNSKLRSMSTEEIDIISKTVNERISKNNDVLDSKMSEVETLTHELDIDLVDIEEYSKIKFKEAKISPEVEAKADIVENQLHAAINDIDLSKYPEKKAKKIKKVVSVMVSDILVNFAKFIPNELNREFLTTSKMIGNQLVVSFQDIQEETNFTRTFTIGDNGEIEKVQHTLFEVPPSAQKTGLSKSAITDMLKLYKAAGIKKVELHANIGMGGYVWLRYGFKPNEDQIPKIKDAFTDVYNCIKYGLKPGYTVGVTPDNVLDAIIKHFDNPVITLTLQTIKKNYDMQKAKLNNMLLNDFGWDKYTEAPVKFNYTFNEIIAETFKNIGSEIAKQFKINVDTLHEDIALSKKDIKLKVPTLKLVTNNKLADEMIRDHALSQATSSAEAQVARTLKAKKVIDKYFGSRIFKMSEDVKFTISVKKFLTMTGISIETAQGRISALPGNPADFAAGIDMMPGAMEWKGYLDLTDEKQFKTAMKYATATK